MRPRVAGLVAAWLLSGCHGTVSSDEAGDANALTPNPGFTSCGTADACVSSPIVESWCALDPASGAGVCETTQMACAQDAGSTLTLLCDEPADCTATRGEVCCFGQVDPYFGLLCSGSGCSQMPCELVGPVPFRRMCKTNGDCPDAGECIPQPCAENTFGLCGVVLEAGCHL